MFKKILPLMKGLLGLGLAVSLLAGRAAAQESRRAGEAGEEKADARELERKAVGLLEEAMRGAEALKLAENRVRVQTVAAGLLWPRDEAAARAAFKLAADGIAAMIADADPSDQQQYQYDRSTATLLRQQLVSVAAPHDARLALDFLRATRQPAPFTYADAEYRQPDPELSLEANLAAQVAAQDAKQGLRMAEESLSRGVSQGLTNVFFQLAAKDKEAAARLATEIIKRLRPEDLARDYEMTNVAIQLLTQTRGEAQPVAAPQSVGDHGETRITPTGVMESRVVIDERSRRQLIEALAAAALSPGTQQTEGVSQQIVRALGAALPEVERYAPTRAAALRRRAERVEEGNPRARAWQQYNELVNGATSVEAMLEAAPKLQPEMRDQLYSSAAYRALVEDDNLERARQLAGHVASPERRAQLVRDLERQLRMNAAQRGEYKDARRLLALTSNVDEKVLLLTQLAAAALNQKDEAAARELLGEARALVGRGESAQQFYALFNVSRAYAPLDAGASFEMTEAAVGRLNELLAAAVVVNGFGQDAFRDGELRQQGGYLWNDLVGRCAQELAHLAPGDFERARSLAGRFERADARVLAQLLLAQHVLQTIRPQTSQIENLPLNRRIFRSIN